MTLFKRLGAFLFILILIAFALLWLPLPLPSLLEVVQQQSKSELKGTIPHLKILPSLRIQQDSLCLNLNHMLCFTKLEMQLKASAIRPLIKRIREAKTSTASVELGQLHIDQLQWRKLLIDSISIPATLDSLALTSSFTKGKWLGKTIHAAWRTELESPNPWSLSLGIEDIPLDSLWQLSNSAQKGHLNGKAELSITAKGQNISDVKKGDVTLKLRSAPALLDDWPPFLALAEAIGLKEQNSLSVDSLLMTAHWQQPRWHIDQLLLSAAEGVLQGKGTFVPHSNPDSSRLDLHFNWDLDVEVLKQADLPKDLRLSLNWIADDSGRLELKFRLKGSLSHPEATLIMESLQKPLERGARRLLRKLFGG